MAFPEKRHPAYDHIDVQKALGVRNGTQAGDPVKGAKAMYELAILKDPSLRVVIGTDAYKAIMGKIGSYGENSMRIYLTVQMLMVIRLRSVSRPKDSVTEEKRAS